VAHSAYVNQPLQFDARLAPKVLAADKILAQRFFSMCNWKLLTFCAVLESPGNSSSVALWPHQEQAAVQILVPLHAVEAAAFVQHVEVLPY
jgi:hypothetical protein